MTKRSRSQQNGRQGSVIVISAPSGAGKSTLVERLLQSVPGLRFSISHTTRAPRPGERNRREYFFVRPAQFRSMIARGEFLEWAKVYGNYYGTSWKQVRAAGRARHDILLDIDIQGHAQVRRRLPEAISAFVLPPSLAELERRLRRRHLDAPEVIEKRLAKAREEIGHWPEYDYLVVNDRLPAATRALERIVLASRFRRQNQEGAAREIVKTFGGKK